ncbi:MAG: hypothetical protein N3F63_05735 [Thermoplasmata archaeon]|nr:hypothetical protein [Thermoplasmata archaeon]
MVDIREKVEEDRGILKKIQLLIPGYAGYRRREDIRIADNLLRIQLADKLKLARQDVESCRRVLVENYETKHLEKIGSLSAQFQRLEGDLRHAEQGYSGISPALQIKEAELNKLYEFDYSMASLIESIREEVNSLKTVVNTNPEKIPENITKIRQMLDDFDQTFKRRIKFITGTEV